jgi:hypothetical protein
MVSPLARAGNRPRTVGVIQQQQSIKFPRLKMLNATYPAQTIIKRPSPAVKTVSCPESMIPSGGLQKMPFPQKLTLAAFARVRQKIRFPGTCKSTLSKDIQSQSGINGDCAGPDHVGMFLIYVNRVKIRMTSDLVFQAGRKE